MKVNQISRKKHKTNELEKSKKSKYNVDDSEKGKQNRTYKGIEYASEMEMRYYRDVIEPEMEIGNIIKCERQVKYELVPSFKYRNQTIQPIYYVSDFDITYSDGTKKVIDVKGLAKPIDVIKRKLLLYRYPEIDFAWVTYSKIDGGWRLYEDVKKARAKRKREKLKKGKDKCQQKK